MSDDSTNDETEKIIPLYLEADSRIKYFRHKGFTGADNWKFLNDHENPAAEYVNWLMDDDLFYPYKLEIMVEVYRNNPDVSLVTSRRDFIDQDTNVISKSPKIFEGTMKVSGEEAGKLLFCLDNYIGELTTGLIRKKFLRNDNFSWLDSKGTALPDVSTWLQLLTQGNLFWIDESLSAFRNHPGQDTFSGSTGPLTVLSWAKCIKAVLDRNIFLKTETEIRSAFIHWLNIFALKLRESQYTNYNGSEITIAEEFYIAMAKAFRNGYKIELPPIKYPGADNTKIFETEELS